VPADGGIRFGQYVLLRRIARGGMAEVFLAQQRGLEGFDRRVAVKRILPHLADSPDFVKMFLGEAKLAAQLTHPNIVHIYDFGKVDHDYFIAMEYVEGVHTGQIFKLGEREPRMSPTLVARIGADAAAALNYAHELEGPNGLPLGLVHRDVSPANIMVSHDGIVKLCDFGIAKAMALTDQLTNPGQVKGKYAYMSPEQTIAAPLDGRSDVFSLAIVLWELLTGRTIVPRGDAVDAMRAIRDGKLMPIDKAAPHTPAPLAKALTWALENKREKRATASEFAQALEAFIKVSPELATPLQLAQWVRTRFPRDASGPQPQLPRAGTNVAPRTSVAAGTMAGTGSKLSAVTPSSNLIGASIVSQPDETAETVQLVSSSELASVSENDVANATVLENLARGIANRPTTPRASVAGRPMDRTLHASEEPTTIDRATMIGNETIGDNETMLSAGARREIVSSGPAVVPTQFHQRLEPGHGTGVQRPSPMVTDKTLGLRRSRPRYLVPIVALGGVAVLSFLIALAARSPTVATEHDAGADARAALAAVDATPVDAAPVDAREPTIRADAAPAPTAWLVVTTTPQGATVKIGDQSRMAPGSFALDAGTYDVVAELEGYQPERRRVAIEVGEHKTYEIVFKTKLAVQRPAPPQVGKLSVRTRPYSDVSYGTRKLGQSPFEINLPVGSYTLTFKNPAHPTVTRTVKITAGKRAKVIFDLPK
jgi:serine/threonine-protein kinase